MACHSHKKIVNQRKGFTLLELCIVIAIIGILSTIAFISLNRARAKARDAKRIGDMEQLQTILELYAADHQNEYPNEYPPSPGSGFIHGWICINDTVEGDCWQSPGEGPDLWIPALNPYAKKLPSDPRGIPDWIAYQYKQSPVYGYVMLFRMESNAPQNECKLTIPSPPSPANLSTRCARVPSP
jgi:prepilin-type N-terminal cleavage/methylation domain-containing protein